MANNNDSNLSKSNTSINKKIDILNQKVDGLYKDIYISRPDNKENLNDIIDNLDSLVDQLQNSTGSSSGMTELINRLDNKNASNSEKMISSVQGLFEDQSLLGNLMTNQEVHNYIAGQNYNYDLICKYLPKLQDALEIKRDNVLCSDNFSKTFLNPQFNRSSKEEVEKFTSNIKRLENEYDISTFFDKTYMNTSKYGEDFIYVVPYDVAFKRLLKRDAYAKNGVKMTQASLFESYTPTELLKDGFQNTNEFKDYITNVKVFTEEDNPTIPELGKIKLYFNYDGVINSAVNEVCVLRDKYDVDEFKSLSTVFSESVSGDNTVSTNEAKDDSKLDSLFVGLNDKKRSSKFYQYQNDGLILDGSLDRDPDKIDNNFYGAVLERLPRENVVPVYIGKKCLGYYYFEFAEDPSRCGFCGGHHSSPLLGNANVVNNQLNEEQQELAIRYIANKISQTIDSKFINANKDLKEEIYQLLNYNDKFNAMMSNNIGITFIPAEDVVHTYFELDEHTHRGISDLERAVTPAMLYILLYLTDIIGKITRSTDKRVYYVKQNIETNVARTMMNVVQQIKKGNMGMRQIESMNNILNIVGKYNDLIIPMGPSGDAPVQFEIMQGQDIQTPTDIMEKMEEAAVNTIIPFEFVNSTYQTDFASRFTMSNTRFLKTIYTRQRKTEKFFSKIYTKIYNYEFGENINLIEVLLPPPTYLTMNNNTQLIDNISQMADKIVDTELNREDDDVKEEFKKLYIREHLSTYIDFDKIQKIKDIAKINVETEKNPSVEDGASAEDMLDDEF